MEPEIARRCTACGAAVRGRAKFCPQCGLNMSEAPTLIHDTIATAPAADAAPPRDGGTGIGSSSNSRAHEFNSKLFEVSEASSGRELVESRPAETEAPTSAASPAASEHARRARVGQRREAATGRLHDTANDPGGERFVLLAGAFFIFFLLLFILSYVLR